MAKVPALIGALVSDGASLFTIPTGSALAFVEEYLRKRSEEAREIAIEELRSGQILDTEVPSSDEAAGVILRYYRAAREDAARINLRLLAKVIAGRLQAGNLVADEFIALANALDTLSRDEIVLLGTMYKHYVETEGEGSLDGKKPWDLAHKSLCSGVFATEDEFQAIGARSQRSGFVVPMSGRSQGRMGFKLSPLFFQLTETVDFLDALRKEGIQLP